MIGATLVYTVGYIGGINGERIPSRGLFAVIRDSDPRAAERIAEFQRLGASFYAGGSTETCRDEVTDYWGDA